MAVKRFDHTREAEYVGHVLADREWNGYDDSDFYAVVWDRDHLQPKRVDYHTTRGASTGSCKIDATSQVLHRFEQYRQYVDRRFRIREFLLKSQTVQKGSNVKIIRGRKVPIGATGKVIWIGHNRFDQYNDRIGIATSDQKDSRGRYVDVIWTYADNVQVTDAKARTRITFPRHVETRPLP